LPSASEGIFLRLLPIFLTLNQLDFGFLGERNNDNKEKGGFLTWQKFLLPTTKAL